MSKRTKLANAVLAKIDADDWDAAKALTAKIETEHGMDMAKTVADLVSAELLDRAEQSKRQMAASAEIGTIFDGLPEGTTLQEAAEIKARGGDPLAIAWLAHQNSRASRLYHALFDAAVDTHPDWQRTAPGHYKKTGSPLREGDDHRLIDWFQTNHPREARAIEDAIDAEVLQ